MGIGPPLTPSPLATDLWLSFPKNSSEEKMPADGRGAGKAIRHKGVLQPLERDEKARILGLGA